MTTGLRQAHSDVLRVGRWRNGGGRLRIALPGGALASPIVGYGMGR